VIKERSPIEGGTKPKCGRKGGKYNKKERYSLVLSFENGVFSLNFSIAKEDEEILYQWTKEICEYRLHVYFERKENKK